MQDLLETLLGSRNVYFQPPASVQMQYPCIVYTLADIDTKRADNMVYAKKNGYALTVIDQDPDSLIPDKILDLKMSSFVRKFTQDMLNHTVFNIYY